MPQLLTRSNILTALVIIAALTAGLLLSRWLLPDAGVEGPAVGESVADGRATTPLVSASAESAQQLVGQPHPGFRHGRSDGAIVTMDDFAGQVVLVNFWASWCEPCREEMPMLQRLNDEWSAQEFTVVGIALDDVARVRDFVARHGIRYPILVGGPDVMATSRRWGNRAGALPYTVLVDRQGVVRWRYLGPLREPALRREVEALLP